MPRLNRLVVPDLPHHVTQRGNGRRDVFLDDLDRMCYLGFLLTEGKAVGLRISAYCLMTNHVHIVAFPPNEYALAAGIGRAHWSYSRAFNRRHGRSGALWQARFFSCPMDEAHHFQAVRYVELNPVRAGLVSSAEEYPWSSARTHLTGDVSGGVLDLTKNGDSWGFPNWESYLKGSGAEADRSVIRANTTRGRLWEASKDS